MGNFSIAFLEAGHRAGELGWRKIIPRKDGEIVIGALDLAWETYRLGLGSDGDRTHSMASRKWPA
jgi:hypothetical protein